MKYSFKCPACSDVVSVDASNDDEAVEKLMAEGKSHAAASHPDMPPTDENQMRDMVRAQMTKGETEGSAPAAPAEPQGMGQTPGLGSSAPAAEAPVSTPEPAETPAAPTTPAPNLGSEAPVSNDTGQGEPPSVTPTPATGEENQGGSEPQGQ